VSDKKVLVVVYRWG